MPFLINKNHFCLAIADFQKKTFTYINPLGNEILRTNKYLKSFLLFLDRFND